LPHAQINITPLIDILLVLLVIFMVITPQTAVGHDARIPQPPSAQVQQPPTSPLVLSIDGAGQIRLNRQIVEQAELGSRLQDIFRTRNDRTIFLHADHGLLYNDAIAVIDIAQTAGAQRVGLLAENPEASR
jgi:biopolymer transport protein ExbD